MAQKSAMTRNMAFPREFSVGKAGWTLTIKCTGVFTEFVPTHAQCGDPKGSSITLEGPDGKKVEIVAGKSRCPACGASRIRLPLNLRNDEKQFVSQLAAMLEEKYNLVPDYSFLHELVKEGLAPYSHGRHVR